MINEVRKRVANGLKGVENLKLNPAGFNINTGDTETEKQVRKMVAGQDIVVGDTTVY